MRFKAKKKGFVVVYNKTDPEFTWVDAKKKAIDDLEKYKKSKTYEDYVLRKQFIKLLQEQNNSVEKRVNLLSMVIASISDDDTEIVNKKG